MNVSATLLLSIALVFTAAPARADTLSTLTITGDGHTVEFKVPTNLSATDHPHNISVPLMSSSVTVDGTSGYSVFGQLLVVSVTTNFPTLSLTFDPFPPGFPVPSQYALSDLDLWGGPVTKLVSDVPDPLCTIGPCYDTLTFALTPGSYTFFDRDPGQSSGPYTVDVVAASALAPKPEPSAWLLVLTGVLGLCLSRRSLIQERA